VVTLYRAARWKIAIYAGDHGIPHYHIEGPGYRCSVAIASGEVIIGSVPANVLRGARDWAEPRAVELMAKWQELNG
jgi:hypothetical protein